MYNDFEKALELIKRYETIIIHRHSSPDGDAMGSQIGLAEVLKANFPEKQIYVVGDRAGRYSFVGGRVMDEVVDEVYSGAMAILLDMSEPFLVSDDRYTLAECTLRNVRCV